MYRESGDLKATKAKIKQLQPSLLSSSIRWFNVRPLIFLIIFYFVVIKIYILAKKVWLIDQFIKHSQV